MPSLIGSGERVGLLGCCDMVFDGDVSNRLEDKIKIFGQLWVFLELHQMGEAGLEIFKILESILMLRDKESIRESLPMEIFNESIVQAKLLSCFFADLVRLMSCGAIFLNGFIERCPELGGQNLVKVVSSSKDFCESVGNVVARMDEIISIDYRPIFLDKAGGVVLQDAIYFANNALDEVSRGIEKIIESLRVLSLHWSKFINQA